MNLGAVGSGYTEIVGDAESAFELIDESAMQAGNLETGDFKQQQIKFLKLKERATRIHCRLCRVKKKKKKRQKKNTRKK